MLPVVIILQMLLFGHVGITVGTVYLVSRLLPAGARRPAVAEKITEGENTLSGSLLSRFFRNIDYRCLAVGSMLPDIIDKPVGEPLLGNGRIFCHTLFFAIVLILAALVSFRKKGIVWPSLLAIGTVFHLVLDGMWLDPGTFLWPLYGFAFPRYEIDVSGWLESMLRAFFTSPAVFISEVVGLAILVFLGVRVIYRKKIMEFLRTGIL